MQMPNGMMGPNNGMMGGNNGMIAMRNQMNGHMNGQMPGMVPMMQNPQMAPGMQGKGLATAPACNSSTAFLPTLTAPQCEPHLRHTMPWDKVAIFSSALLLSSAALANPVNAEEVGSSILDVFCKPLLRSKLV